MIDQTLTELIQGDAPSGVILDRLREIHLGKDDEALATAYIVMGEFGEYSDHYDWFVAAYIDQDAAQDLLKQIIDYRKEHPRRNTCPLDLQYQRSAIYSVCPIPLKG